MRRTRCDHLALVWLYLAPAHIFDDADVPRKDGEEMRCGAAQCGMKRGGKTTYVLADTCVQF